MKVFLALLIVAHGFLGQAIAAPAAPPSYETVLRQAIVMVMTPVLPMSPLHCRGCVAVALAGTTADPQSPCTSEPAMAFAPRQAAFTAGWDPLAVDGALPSVESTTIVTDTPVVLSPDERPRCLGSLLPTVILRQ